MPPPLHDHECTVIPTPTFNVVDTQPTCMFWKLPLELRDMVYDLVYGEAREILAVTRVDWETAEKRRKRSERRPYIFPESVLSELLVSKQYLDEAAKIYIQHKVLFFDYPVPLAQIRGSDTGCPVNRRLIELVSSVRFEQTGRMLRGEFLGLPRMRCLELGVTDEDFEVDDAEKHPFLDEYSDLDLFQLPWIQTLSNLRGLDTVKITTAPVAWMPQNNERDSKWASLLLQVQTLLTDVMTKPRPSGMKAESISLLDSDLSIPRSTDDTSFSIASPSLEDANAAAQPERALTARDIPRTESEFARLMFTNPKALFKWNCNAAERLEEAEGL